jgi:hypothetical protein
MEFGEVQGFDASIVADAGIIVLETSMPAGLMLMRI